ncbi:NAD(P)/FAD-dependent oxidoreductase [Bacillus sp. UNC41MFS5]|uniref:NAD(P)/FAD-dependent oxidoreductase n=1 Tax=Bacillus sp. UNC41MFS5 TaxID=1449046 RepID=UPI00054E34B1|nr:FAD-binding oxidoreductase [Bacillus sp. UNC41MFS5]
MGYPSSLWKHTAKNLKLRYPLTSDVEVDTAIIGGGYTGLATAYFLQSLGIQSAIVEQHHIGWGASGRNAGMSIPGFKMHIGTIMKKWGHEAANEMLNMSIDGIKLVTDIIHEHDIDCSLSNQGSISAAFKESHFETFKRNQEFMEKHFQYRTTVLNRHEVETELGTDIYHGLLVDPHAISFHPLNYALGLAKAVEERGVTIFEKTPVSKITKQQDKVILDTPQGRVKASHLVIATNGYTTSLTPKLFKSVIPMGSYMIATEPLDNDLAQKLIPQRRSVSDSKKFLYYFRLSPDNRMIFGGRVSFDCNETPEVYEQTHRNMLSVFPELKDYKVDYKWGGLIALTPDMLPHIGKTEEGFHFALGYSGRGATISTLMGKLLALNIKAEERPLHHLEKLPLRQIPLHSQRGMALNLVGAYYKLLDKWG